MAHEQVGTLLDHLLASYREEINAIRGELAELRQEIRRDRQQPPAPAHRATIRIKEVCSRSGLSRATIYRLESEGKWPRRYRLTDGTVGWDEAEVEARIAEMQATRVGGTTPR
ncbi:MAG TPA: AlpA family phage regulatory protein [Thermoanaerobaculia bacterium]|nr:AlpA family phage regulatory protein [Thermoanaerobaculia bacterium]